MAKSAVVSAILRHSPSGDFCGGSYLLVIFNRVNPLLARLIRRCNSWDVGEDREKKGAGSWWIASSWWRENDVFLFPPIRFNPRILLHLREALSYRTY